MGEVGERALSEVGPELQRLGLIGRSYKLLTPLLGTHCKTSALPPTARPPNFTSPIPRHYLRQSTPLPNREDDAVPSVHVVANHERQPMRPGPPDRPSPRNHEPLSVARADESALRGHDAATTLHIHEILPGRAQEPVRRSAKGPAIPSRAEEARPRVRAPEQGPVGL